MAFLGSAHVADRGLWLGDRGLSLKVSGFSRNTRETAVSGKVETAVSPCFWPFVVFLRVLSIRRLGGDLGWVRELVQ